MPSPSRHHPGGIFQCRQLGSSRIGLVGRPAGQEGPGHPARIFGPACLFEDRGQQQGGRGMFPLLPGILNQIAQRLHPRDGGREITADDGEEGRFGPVPA